MTTAMMRRAENSIGPIGSSSPIFRVRVDALLGSLSSPPPFSPLTHSSSTVENAATETVRVVSRHWKIYADDELVVEVPLGSPGVIGMKPELPPGATFMYYSGTDVAAGRTGFMTGSLGLVVVGSKSPSETIHAVVPRMEFM